MRLFSCLALAIVGLPAFAQSSKFVSNEILVKVKPEFSPSLALASIRGRVVSTIPGINVYQIRLNNGINVVDSVKSLSTNRMLQYAEPNYVGKWLRAPNDARFNNQYGPQRANLPSAWDLHIGQPITMVAVLDSGFRRTHEDLRNQIAPQSRAFDGGATIDDEVGHGTHCGGIAAASTNNRIGIAGAGWNVRLLALKLGNLPSTSASAAALVYAADNGAKAASMSYGVPPSQTELAAINYCLARQVLPVAAAGNDGQTGVNFPAGYPGVLSVAASDRNDARADFSTHGDWVDVAAPGVDILSTYNGSDTDYQELSGTSMACPLVAGSVALMASYSPTSTAEEIREAILNTALPVGYVSNGRVDIGRAIRMLKVADPIEVGVDGAAVLNQEGIAAGNLTSAAAAARLRSEDGNMVEMQSTRVRSVGSVASMAISLISEVPATEMALMKLNITGSANQSVTSIVFIWNNNSGSWQSLSTSRLSPTPGTQSVSLPTDMTPYVSDGLIRIAVRAILPARLGGRDFRTMIDRVWLSGFRSTSGSSGGN